MTVTRIPSYGKSTEEEFQKDWREYYENEFPVLREKIQNFINTELQGCSVVLIMESPVEGVSQFSTIRQSIQTSLGLLEFAKQDIAAGMVKTRITR